MDLSLQSEPSNDVPLDGIGVVGDLQWLINACEERSITDTIKWACDIVQYLPAKWITAFESSLHTSSEKPLSQISLANREISLGRSLLNTKEFPRATFFFGRMRDRDSVTKFLYYWSRYLTCVRDLAEHEAETFDRKAANATGVSDVKDNAPMSELLHDMYADAERQPELQDAFLMYLQGKVEAALGMDSVALSTMIAAIEMEPRLWPAWLDAVQLIPNAEQIDELMALETANGYSWMACWFSCLALSRFNFDRVAIKRCKELLQRGMTDLPMILLQMAACSNRILEHDSALNLFGQVRKVDPFQLDNMHLYSDSLFCMGQRVELNAISHIFFKAYKFKWETCCIVGNYYNMRGDHEQAIRFFQRALRLNPKMAGIWVLIGHEFLELKNNAAACMAYRRATEIDPNDYRGWYGLGQMYDILKMHTYALTYYQEAHRCRPQDSRMLVALGAIYTKLGNVKDAQKAYTSAYKYGDVEGNALWHLANLFDTQGLKQQAAQTFETYLTVNDGTKSGDDNLSFVVHFLAKHYMEKGDWDKATTYAEQCLQHETISEEGRSILRQVTRLQQQVLPITTSPDSNMEDTQQRSLNESDDMELANSDAEDSF